LNNFLPPSAGNNNLPSTSPTESSSKPISEGLQGNPRAFASSALGLGPLHFSAQYSMPGRDVLLALILEDCVFSQEGSREKRNTIGVRVSQFGR